MKIKKIIWGTYFSFFYDSKIFQFPVKIFSIAIINIFYLGKELNQENTSFYLLQMLLYPYLEEFSRDMKSATVTVIGRPSAGKSTLLNTICGMKVSITAKTPQTTRNRIKGIYTDQRGQLVFVDTPGYHISGKEMNKRLQNETLEALKETDIILYVIDGTRKGELEEKEISSIINATGGKCVAAINKCDIAEPDRIKETISFIEENLPSAEVLEISAKEDEGVDELLIKLFALSDEGELLYDDNAYTDQPLEFRISEIIREKTISELKDEMPHVIFVEVSDIEYSEEENEVWIRAFINVERDSQKGIVVGKGGENIRRIRKESFKEIKRIFPSSRLNLDLRVKAVKNWRSDKVILDKIFNELNAR